MGEIIKFERKNPAKMALFCKFCSNSSKQPMSLNDAKKTLPALVTSSDEEFLRNLKKIKQYTDDDM